MAQRQSFSRSRARSRGGRQRATGTRVWRGIAATGLIGQAVGNQTIVEVLNPQLDNIANGTIQRILGNYSLRAQASGFQIFWRAGLIVVHGDAFAAGAVPDPWADPAQWMWEDSGYFETDGLSNPAHIQRIRVDVRVKRRMPQDNSHLVFVSEVQSGSGAGMDFHLNLKCLVRVP